MGFLILASNYLRTPRHSLADFVWILPRKDRKYETGQEIHLEPDIDWGCDLNKDPSYTWNLRSLSNESHSSSVVAFNSPTLLLFRFIQVFTTPARGEYPKDVRCEDEASFFRIPNYDFRKTTSDGWKEKSFSFSNDLERYENPLWNLIDFYHIDEILEAKVSVKSFENNLNSEDSIEGQKLQFIRVSDQLKVGNYSAEISIHQKLMSLSSKANTTFEVIDPPLRQVGFLDWVRFLGGDVRYVAKGSPIELTVEIRVPKFSSYNVSWNCETCSDDYDGCFSNNFKSTSSKFRRQGTMNLAQKLMALSSSFSSSEFSKFQNIVNSFTIEKYDEVIKYLIETSPDTLSAKELLNLMNTDYKSLIRDRVGSLKTSFNIQDGYEFSNQTIALGSSYQYPTSTKESVANSTDGQWKKSSMHFDANTETVPPGDVLGEDSNIWNAWTEPAGTSRPHSFQNLYKNDDDEESRQFDLEFFDKLFFVLNLLTIEVFQNDTKTITESFTIAAEDLRPNVSDLIFEVQISTSRENATDRQLISIIDEEFDSVGILQTVPNQRPLGSTRRIIFESECLSCSDEELQQLWYRWSLQRIILTAEESDRILTKSNPTHSNDSVVSSPTSYDVSDYEISEEISGLTLGCNFDYDDSLLGVSPWVLENEDTYFPNSRRYTRPIITPDDVTDVSSRHQWPKYGRKWEKVRREERKLLLRLKQKLGFASLDSNGKGVMTPSFTVPSDLTTPHSVLSVLSSSSSLFSSCFSEISPGLIISPVEWEASPVTQETKETLNGSICAQLVLMTRELFTRGIKFSKGERRPEEGNEEVFRRGTPLSPRRPRKGPLNINSPQLSKIDDSDFVPSYLPDWIFATLIVSSLAYSQTSGADFPTRELQAPPAGDVKTERERLHLAGIMAPPHLRSLNLLLQEISGNPNVNCAPQTVSDKLPLSAKSHVKQIEVIPSNNDDVSSEENLRTLKEFSLNSHKYSNQVFHKENLEQNSTGKFSEFQTIGKSPDLVETLNLSSTPKDFEEQRQNVQFATVVRFAQMTSTGTRQPVLVIYMDNLDSKADYILTLKTHNPVNGKRGQAKQYLHFSTPPTIFGCHLLKNTSKPMFHSGCNYINGINEPIKLLYRYYFEPHGPKTVFYFGSLPTIDFALPSGYPSTNYMMYVSIEAVDGKGVGSLPKIMNVTVKPRYKSNTGIYFLFLEISTLYKENPALEMQHIRTLAWELDLLPPTLVSQIFDTIIAIMFYQDLCEQGIEKGSHLYSSDSFGDQWKELMNNNEQLGRFLYNRDLFVKSNLLKSCAREQLVMKLAAIPTRDETEVLMMITTLIILIDASEAISWFTFRTVVDTMLITKIHLMWYYDLQSKIRSEIAQQYFLLTSEVLDHEFKIYDCPSVPNSLIDTIVGALLDVMTKEATSSILEEDYLDYSTSALKVSGYRAKGKVLYPYRRAMPKISVLNVNFPGFYSVIILEHSRSPYANTSVEINTHVLNIKISWRDINPRKLLQVNLARSIEVNKNNYDFRKKGTLNFESIPVYAFEITEANLESTLMITLEVYRVYTPVSAVLMICKDMQNLKEPLKKTYLNPGDDRVTLMVTPKELEMGQYLIVIIDSNSYENQNWPGYNMKPDKQYGIDFLLGAWWSDCYVWNKLAWASSYCHVLDTSSWDSLICNCSSSSTIYGGLTTPLLTQEDSLAINQLMLIATFVALYFIIFLLVIYSVIVLLFFRQERAPVKRQNLWLKENDAEEHRFAYLLTIKTGAQRHAGTSSNVFAILHGTDAMSDTRMLQAKREDQLFTRGSVCSFIWTSHVELGDILSVQTWHDNCDNKIGWFICEVSVANLNSGATFVFPCYKWLSVASEDGQVTREISFEKPTSFAQDFLNWLPQYVSEHTLWYTMFTSGKSERFFRLQSLTILVTVCLLLGTIALNVVQFINSSHTMMTPDPHIETLYYGFVIAAFLLPVQWILRLVFQVTNKLEERDFYKKVVKDMMNNISQKPFFNELIQDDAATDGDSSSTDEDDFLNPNAKIWDKLKAFGHAISPDEIALGPGAPPLVATLRRRRNIIEDSAATEPTGGAKNRPTIKVSSISFSEGGNSPPRDPSVYIDIKGEITEQNKFEIKGRNCEDCPKDPETLIKSTRIYTGIGWFISLCCVALCTVMLVKTGSGMPKDYSSLWTQLVITTLCASTFIVQPLALLVFALYKVCVYRIFGYRGIALFCKPVPLEQAITVWKHFKERTYHKMKSKEQRIEEARRKRELRLTHPVAEDLLLQCRVKVLMKERISSLFYYSFCYFSFLFILVTIIHNIHLEDRYQLNSSLHHSASNGSCINKKDPVYTAFKDIQTSHDWWRWAQTELIDLSFNFDKSYATSHHLFCDTNSLVVGTPRIKRYYSEATTCASDDVLLSSNDTMSQVLGVKNCYPNYRSESPIIHGFLNLEGQPYDWDDHYLSLVHGIFSKYGDSDEESVLPENRYLASLFLIGMQATHLSFRQRKLRAILTEFTLFHPQSHLYSSVDFLAEFPSSSSANNSVLIASTLIDKYPTYWAYTSKIAELVLVAVSMALIKRTSINLFKNRGRFWITFWSILDLLMTVACWTYVICLMLRVRIAEDLLWLLKESNYEEFVNIKSLAAWDNVLGIMAGLLLSMHVIRFLWILNFIPLMNKLQLVLYAGTREAIKMTFGVLFLVLICSHLGYMWFQKEVYEFSSYLFTVAEVIKSLVFRTSFYNQFSRYVGFSSIIANIFFLIVFILLFFMVFGIYKAIFINAKKNSVYAPRSVEITFKDIRDYLSDWNPCKRKKIESEAETFNPSSYAYLGELEMLLEQLNAKVDAIFDLTNNLPAVVSEPSCEETNCVEDSDETAEQIDHSINMRAFDQFTSTPSVAEATTINLLEEITKRAELFKNTPEDKCEHMTKFLDEVTSISPESSVVSTRGKYGKSILKLKPISFERPRQENENVSFVIPPEENEISDSESEEEGHRFSATKIQFEGIEELLKKYGVYEDSDDEPTEMN